jgi:hypothetical protein
MAVPSNRPLNATTVLAAVALLALPAVAHAKVHRFAPTTDVTVSFALAKKSKPGTLVRFARNGLSLTRGHAGRLTLRASRRGERHVALTGHGSPSVRIELSARRARLTVGDRTASMAGHFVAEDALAIGGARLRNLQIHAATSAPSRAGGAALASTTSSAASPAASAVTTTAAPIPPGPLFAPDSVWNAPLPANAALDPANSVLTKTLRDTVAQNLATGWGPWIGTAGTSPLYTVSGTQPTRRVTLDPGSWKVGLQTTFEAVPIPADAAPAAGPDGHMTVWQPSTNHLWEFFKASKLADGWHASFGGSMSSASQSPGYFNTDSWPGVSKPWWGATASSLPVIAGTMLIQELQSGVIPHALAMNIPWAKPKTWSWPAQRTDGTSIDPNAIPEGARFRLDPTLNIDALNLPPMTRMMAKAAQRYGMIVRDQTGHAISLFAENPAQYGTDPYTLPGGFYGSPNPIAVMRAFPWDRLQLLKMDVHTVA